MSTTARLFFTLRMCIGNCFLTLQYLVAPKDERYKVRVWFEFGSSLVRVWAASARAAKPLEPSLNLAKRK